MFSRYERDPSKGWYNNYNSCDGLLNCCYINFQMPYKNYEVQLFYYVSVNKCENALQNGPCLLYFSHLSEEEIEIFEKVLVQFDSNVYKIREHSGFITINNVCKNQEVVKMLAKQQLISFEILQDIMRCLDNLPEPKQRTLVISM